MQSLTELDLDGKVNYWLHAHLIDLGLNEGSAIVVKVLFFVFATLVIGFITNYITKQIIVKVIETIIKRSETIYDDYFVEHKVFHHLSHLAPASVVYFLRITSYNVCYTKLLRFTTSARYRSTTNSYNFV